MKKIYLLLAVTGFMSSSYVFAQTNIGEFLAKNPEVGSLCAEYKKDSGRKFDSSLASKRNNEFEFGFGVKGVGINMNSKTGSDF